MLQVMNATEDVCYKFWLDILHTLPTHLPTYAFLDSCYKNYNTIYCGVRQI